MKARTANTILLISAGFFVVSMFMIARKEDPFPSLTKAEFIAPHASRTSIRRLPRNLGRRIVERAFNESYVNLVQLDHRGSGINYTDGNSQKHLLAMRALYGMRKDPTLAQKWPWWFHTLLRDIVTKPSGLHGGWHLLYFPKPANFNLCLIEKAGTKEWRRMQCKFFHKDLDILKNMTPREASNCYLQTPGMNQRDSQSKQIIFLRDPLERFLSGFLDKCVRDKRATGIHCEPLVVFKKSSGVVDEFIPEYKTGVSFDASKLFEIYVDTFPLRWNIHFFPQSLFCGGLYSELPKYDFVGNMGDKFYLHLERFSNQFPILKPFMEDQFHLAQMGDHNNGVETKAASHTESYYTPRTLRKVLEYMSIDYVMLGLPIPRWAEDMLAKDSL